MPSIYDWSTTAANNATADSDINWAEGQGPSTVNNSARQVMGRVAEWRGDVGGALTAGGTANAITVTANSAFTSYADGQRLTLRIAADNTSAATLNVNAIGAKSIRKMLATGESALTGAELQADGIYELVYSTALNTAAGGWLLLNPTGVDPATLVTLTGSQTLTNKTLTSPAVNTPTITGGSGSGMTLTTATLTTPTLTLKQSTTPAPTAEGDIQWDTDDDVIVIGDGAAQKIFAALPASTAAGDVLYLTSAKALARLAKGTAGSTLRMNSGASAPEWAGANGPPDAVMEDQKSSGVGAQVLNSGSWITRDLNTEARDPSGLVSISANQFTVTVSGWVEWDTPALAVTLHQSRLYNVTDGAAVAYGTSERSDHAGAYATSSSKGNASVVAGKTYRIEHQVSANGNGGTGSGVGFTGNTEVYTRVKFWRT